MTSHNNTIIFWFRQDLRLSDNPALQSAVSAAEPSSHILPIYILDATSTQHIGRASKVWLHHSLKALNTSLEGHLNCFMGDPETIITELAETWNAKQIFWNRLYDPDAISRDSKLKNILKTKGIQAQSFNGSLLWEPWEVMNKQNEPYKVFTPFYRKGCLNAAPPREPIKRPEMSNLLKDPASKDPDSLGLLPKVPVSHPWHQKMDGLWTYGELAAKNRLKHFLTEGISGYKEGRNIPAIEQTSRLSPHLHFGEISPHQVWHAVRALEPTADTEHFCSELGWREFSYYLLFHFPHISDENFNPKYNNFPWVWSEDASEKLTAWQKGQTGYPIIDAGMRELWQTGYMHNRVRMIVASFLVKNLGIHWKEGERWFWDTLLDADKANNTASWQWVAGSGADAAPYFRIFNPVTQAAKFDATAIYIKKFIPELKNLNPPHIFAPFDAPDDVLEKAGVKLGINYPNPIVDLKSSRDSALKAYDMIRM